MVMERGLGAPLVVIALSVLNVGASKPVPPLTMEQLATPWVGGTPGGEYARLDISADGTGVLAVQYLAHHQARAYRVTRTVLNGYNVHFQVEPAEDQAESIFLGGRGYLFTLELRIGGSNGQWRRALTLERLSDVTERLEAVSNRIKELREGSATRDGV